MTKVAITGGTGFVGRHLAAELNPEDTLIMSRRTGHDLQNVTKLVEDFQGIDVVVHAAGINREIGDQTYQKVHVEATRNVVTAAKQAGVKKIILISFLRARPNCNSAYHESKWESEEIVRNSGITYTVLKAGMIYGKGDHLVDHISHSLQTQPLFPTVGLHEKTIRPVPVKEFITIIKAVIDGELDNMTVPVVGGEELLFSDAVKRVGHVIGYTPIIFPMPVMFHKGVAQLTEWTMKVPLLAKAQARMLAEGVSEVAPEADTLPDHLKPRLWFNGAQIREALPERGRFGLKDLRITKWSTTK